MNGTTSFAARRGGFWSLLFLPLLTLSATVYAQSAPEQGTPPAPDASCTVHAMNRSAPLQSDYSFTIYNIPGAAAFFPGQGGVQTPAAPFRVRATCSDGTVGETEMAFPEFGSTVVYTGPLYWRPATPIPLALSVLADSNQLNTNQTAQLSTTGVLPDASTVDLTQRSRGTLYTSSNPNIATVNENGLVQVTASVASGSSARIVMTAQNEGVAGSTLLTIGPRGRVAGRVTRADGVAPASGAEVNILRLQPRETVATVESDAGGNFAIEDVGAGAFLISVLDRATGDMGRGSAQIENAGETATADVRLNGQGTVNVTVLSGTDTPVANAPVSFTSLSGFRDLRTVQTDAAGRAVFPAALAGEFTVSTRAANLVGTSLGTLAAGGSADITLRLQPVGSISGAVLAAEGGAAVEGVQVRLISATRGIVTQAVTRADGAFGFDSLPLSDSPYTLDAFHDGRLRTRVPGLILTSGGQQLIQNIVFGPVGTITGTVTRNNGTPAPDVTISLQSQVGQHYVFTARTDVQGRYRIEAVPAGAFTMTASGANGEIASGEGVAIADAEIAVDLQLSANGIVGVVFQRDGSTPAGTGVAVRLNPGNVTTLTNAAGEFGFSVTQPNRYVIDASDNDGNRGQTEIVLTTISASNPVTANVTFLGRGTVQGVVRDPNNAVQANASVRLSSSSLFGGALETTTNAQGVFAFERVFVGDFTVYARHVGSGLAGIAQARMAGDGETVSADVTLAATGSVSGTVVHADNVTPVAGAVIDLFINGTRALSTTADGAGRYSFAAVPLGDFRLDATNPVNGDKGRTVSRLTTLNEARTANIRLIGVGTVRVHAIDANGADIAAATITLESESIFGGRQTALTDATGVATFASVFNGDFSVSGSKGAGVDLLSGSADGTMIGSATQTVELTMTTKPVGTIRGVVTRALAAEPQSGVEVRLQPLSSGVVRTAVTGTDGAYEFTQIEVNRDFRLTALINGRVRARVEARLNEAGEVLVRDLSLIGVGSVSGVITNAQAQPQSGIQVTLTNSDPVYGGTWTATTQGDGAYNLTDVSAGAFIIRAQNRDGRLQAQNSGTVRFDNDAVTLNLTLVDSAVTMPRTVYDANGATFDIQGTGTIGLGVNSVFRGDNTANTQSNRLEIMVNGVGVPFQNGDATIGRLTQAGQLLEVDEFNSASGLDVTRRIYVPKTGYFARYLEVLENRTENPITVGVRIRSNVSEGFAGARVVDSSNSDNVFANGDTWVVMDDDRDVDAIAAGSGNPAVTYVFDAADGELRAATMGSSNVGDATTLYWQWDAITIPAGGSAGLLHFVSQQVGRISARATAERLVQLPPEALEGLTAEERAIVRNFRLPLDGLSSLPALPTVEANSVTGHVFAGDGTTPIADASITFRNTSPYYGRTYRMDTNASGAYELHSANLGNSNVVALVRDLFRISAEHPRTQAQTPITEGSFAEGQSQAVQDLVFAGTGVLRGSVRRHNGTLVTSGTASIPYRFPNDTNTTQLTTSIRSDGTYEYTGIVPGDYLLSVRQPHPQGSSLIGTAAGAVTVSAGNVSISDATMEQTGVVAGTVRDPIGNPAVNVDVRLREVNGDGTYSRSTQTDTAGAYRFPDARLGAMTVTATAASGSASGGTTVARDATSTLDLQLSGTGTLQIQVSYARGVPAINASVYVRREGTSFGNTIRTNAAGVATYIDATVAATYHILVYHPDNQNLQANTTAVVSTVGQVVEIPMTLPAAGSIAGTVFRPDGTTRAANVAITVRSQSGTTSDRTTQTDGTGSFRVIGLPLGAYTATAADAATFKFADADATLATDGQEVSLSMVLSDNRIALPADLRDANDFQYDIQRDGSIGGGWRNATYSGNRNVYNNGANVLSIAGTAFTGDSSATLEIARRQFSIRQPTQISGLNVTRKVFVPRNGYFARYLEIIENPSASAVTVPVSLTTRIADSNTQVITTESGDNVLSASQDSWAILDESLQTDPFVSTSEPPVAFVIAGSGSVLRPDSMSYADRTVQLGWSNITVPANGRVVLMHFEVQQVNRTGAQAAVERLMQMPGEALQSLSGAERDAIANFVLPAEDATTVEPLPSLLGSISGAVYEGDGTTIVPSAHVQVRSTHPLFGRTYVPKPSFDYSGCEMPTIANSLRSTAQGAYRIAGELRDVGSVAIPIGSDVEISSAVINCSYGQGVHHPRTAVASPVYVEPFAAEASSITRDVIFPTGILEGRLIGPDGFDTTSAQISTVVNNQTVYAQYTNSSRSYLFTGMPAGNFSLAVTAWLARGGDLIGSRAVDVQVGQRLVADIPMEPTGAVIGTVVTANGEAVNGGSLQLIKNEGRYISRSTQTDSLGRFEFTAVPVGQYTLQATDPRTQAVTSLSVSVQENQITTQSVTLIGTGAVNVRVNYARGVAAANADVYLRSQAVSNYFEAMGRTNGEGQLSVLVPVGTFTVRARHPADTYSEIPMPEYSGTMTANNETQSVTLTLQPLSNVRVTATDADAGNAPLANAEVRITHAGCSNCYMGRTNALGQFVINNVRQGNFSLRVIAADGRPASSSGTVDVSTDGQTIEKAIGVTARLSALDVLTFGGERHLYSVPANVNDVIGVYINGTQVGSTASSYITRAEIYSPAKVRLARGYGYDSRNSNAQYNENGDLKNVPASVAGNYTVAVSPYYSDGRYLGGYRLEVRINGETAEVLPYIGGGSVQGVVTDSNGTPAANQLVQIQGGDTLSLSRRARTDAAGNYRFDRVPVSWLNVSAVDEVRGRSITTFGGTLEMADQVLTRDITLPIRTRLEVQVRFGAGVSVPSQISFELNDATGWQSVGPLSVNSTTRESVVHAVNAYGESVTTRVYHPNSSGVNSFITTTGAEGETRSVVHTLAGASLSGTVLKSDGTPASSVQVQVSRVADDGGSSSTYTDSQGRYQFTAIGAGQEMRVSATNPVTYVRTTARFTPEAGAAVVQDLELSGHGTLTGRVIRANGTPVVDVSVQARYITDQERGWENYQYGYTDEEGQFTIDSLPSDQPITMVVWIDTQFGGKEVRQTATIAGDGGTEQVEIVVPTDPGRVLASVVAVDGQTVPGDCYFRLQYSPGGGEESPQEGTAYGACSGMEFNDVPVGTPTLIVQNPYTYAELGSMQVTIVDSTPVEAEIRVSVVKGTVRFADGSAVPYPEVYLYSDEYDSYGYNDENGNYSMFAVPPGNFTVDAQDNDSGLYAEVSGALLDPATPVVLDVTLPPAGTVLGTMTDGAGNPVVEAELYVRSSSLDLDRQVFTGADGSYQVERVAVGQITVWARDPNNGLVSIGTGQIASNGQVVRIDLAPPATGSLSGRVLDVDGVTPIAEAEVTATTVTSFGPFEVLRFDTTAAADGSFVFDELPVGDFRVIAQANGFIGRRQLAVDEDGATVDVPLGDGVTLPFDLTGADGSRYDFSCDASLGDGGFGSDSDAYDGTYQLVLNNWYYFPCVDIADTRQGGRELVFGPYAVYDEIEATRQVYVPASGGYARYLEVLRNPTDQDMTVRVTVQGYLGSYPTQVVVSPASTGNRYAVTAQSDADPALGHVFAGSGAPVAGTFNFNSGGWTVYDWSLVIPAGGQVSLLHFAIQRAHGDTVGAQQQAEALANGTQPGMFDGLSTTDRASLRNFVVTP